MPTALSCTFIWKLNPQASVVSAGKSSFDQAAPHEGLADSAAVDIVVQCALRRAGISPLPTDERIPFRHSLATQMLRNGASISEIAKVLRHQSESSTAIYAKVDLSALRSIAQPLARRCGTRELRKSLRSYLAHAASVSL